MYSTSTTMDPSATACSLSPNGLSAETRSRFSVLVIMTVISIVGCAGQQGGDVADSIVKDVPEVADFGECSGGCLDDGFVTDSVVLTDVPEVADYMDIRDTADHGDVSEAFVCRRPAGQDWDTFLIGECGGPPPHCFDWTLERSSMLLTGPDDAGVEQTYVLSEDKFAEIDCIISSLEFQEMMNNGFTCLGGPVIDASIGFSLILTDDTRLNKDVTSCVYDGENPNLARELAGKVRYWYVEVPDVPAPPAK